MTIDIVKATLADKNEAEARKALLAGQEEFLAQGLPNTVGVGIGVKWSNGEPTGEPAVIALVTHKVDKGELRRSDVVPSTIGGVQSDVLAVGELFAGGDVTDGEAQTLAERVRPAKGGYSVGHEDITAGTLGTCVYDILPDGSTSPPAHGIGMPRTTYILSNNHVLANSNDASVGDPILQPGPIDGGTDPADRIARLSRWVNITFAPPVPLPLHRNLVDAAIAAGEFHDLDRAVYWIGHARAWMPKSKVQVGMLVQKTGRTTNFTIGRVTVINATVTVNYGGGKVARFVDQIVTTPMSKGGDSGSLITSLDEVAVGLLFAGSSQATIANQVEHVRRLLRVEVAEQVA